VHLDLAGNDFSRLPPALSAASCLRRLSLECNERLELSAADAEVLLALPALTSLRLGPPERQEGLEAQAALLALRNHIPEVRVV
jgi:Leucine-rich repeat (LRR) protein